MKAKFSFIPQECVRVSVPEWEMKHVCVPIRLLAAPDKSIKAFECLSPLVLIIAVSHNSTGRSCRLVLSERKDQHPPVTLCVCVWLRQLVKPVIECVRPPRCSKDSAVDGFIVSGTIDTYTYSSHASTEPQHWRAISRSSGGVCCYGFCGLTLSLKHDLGVTFTRNSNEPKYSVASFIPQFHHQI